MKRDEIYENIYRSKIFKGSKPITGLEREILSEALLKSSLSKPTLPGRL